MSEETNAVDALEARLTALDDRIAEDLDGGKIGYDRSSVLKSDYTQIDEIDAEAQKAVLRIKGLDVLAKEYVDKDASGVHGTCRDIAPFTTWRYVEDGLMDNAETYSCAGGGEFHYVTIGKVEGKEVLVDLGYFLPLRNAIPVCSEEDGDSVQSVRSQIKKDGELFDVNCKATRRGDSVILEVKSSDPAKLNYQKTFEFKVVDAERDKETAKGWLGVTGSAYKMDVDGRREPFTPEEVEKGGLLTKEFLEIHKIAKGHKDGIEIILRGEL